MAAKFKKGDRVIVVAGEERSRKGEQPRVGQVLRVYKDEDRVLVQGINMVKRHTKQSARSQGGIVQKEAPIHISNVAHVDPKTGQATRIGFKTLQDGRKVRFAKKSGELIDV
jgi:large subunit ribosomal protein L24